MEIDRNPIEGVATVSDAPPKPTQQRTVWEVNTEEKFSSTTLLGGTITIRRRADTGKFEGRFVVPHPVDTVEGEEAAPTGNIDITLPLHDCGTLVEAQREAEARTRESLSKTHTDIHERLTQAETAAEIEAAGPDPF